MKKIIAIVITILILMGLNFGISYYTHTKYSDCSFFVGLAVTVIILFFSSKGGFTTRSLDMKVRAISASNLEQDKFIFSPNPVFMTSLIYTIFALIVNLYQYRDLL